MKSIALFDIDNKSVEFIDMPFGERIGMRTTNEGYQLWKRDDMVVFGSLYQPKDAVMIVFGTRSYSMDNLDTLKRPSHALVVRALSELQAACSKNQLKKKDDEINVLMKELDELKSREAPVASVVVPCTALEKQAEEFYVYLLQSIRTDVTCKVQGVLDSYKADLERLEGTFQRSKRKCTAKSKAASSFVRKRVFRFEQSPGQWVNVHAQISEILNAYLDGKELPHKALINIQCVIEVFVNGFQYEFRANADNTFTQENKETGVQRTIKEIDEPSKAMSFYNLKKNTELDVVAGTEFQSKVSTDVLSWRFDDMKDKVRISTNPELIDLCTDIATDFAQYTSYDLMYDRRKTEPLIKPTQLQTVMSQVRAGARYTRIVFHATSEQVLDSIRSDARGIDISTGNRNCRYGKAIYVGTTLCSGEKKGHNTTNTPGKTVMCLLVSFEKDPSLKMGSFIFYSYGGQLCKSGSYESYKDAIALYDQSIILPLAIVSP